MPTITYDSAETAAVAHYAAQTSYGSAGAAPVSAQLRAVEEIRPLASILAKHKAGIEASVATADLSEAIDDRVNALLVEGTGVTLTYDDTANTLTIDAAGGGLSGLTTGNIPYADSATTLAEGPIYRCAAQRIGFGGTTDSFPGLRWATEFVVDFVRAAAGAFIGVNAAYFQFGNLSKLQNVSNGVVKVTTDADALGSIQVQSLQIANSAAATTPGTVTKKIEIFDAAGASLGFIAVYDAIT